jgi:hypothetical protein
LSPTGKRDYLVREGTWDRLIFEEVIAGEYGNLDFAGKTVVDIGAHIGAFSVLAALRGARRVLAFEASAENHALLVSNCEDFPMVSVTMPPSGDRTPARACCAGGSLRLSRAPAAARS